MKIFISWSGDRSQALAKALHEWFPIVLHYSEPWLSQSDILAGERWSIEVAKNLEECNFGIICITKENLCAPWILFEAGALAKSMQDGRVIPLLLDLEFKEISGLLAQFQAKKVDSHGMKELVISLNKNAASPIPDDRLEKFFSMSWGEFENQLRQIPTSPSSKNERPEGEILEELVSSVRNVEIRIRDVMESDQPTKKRKRAKRYSIVTDIADLVTDGPEDPIRLILVASHFREEIPWLYELSVETYRTIKLGLIDEARKELRKLRESIDLLARGSLIDISEIDLRMTEIFYQVIYSVEKPYVTSGMSESLGQIQKQISRLRRSDKEDDLYDY